MTKLVVASCAKLQQISSQPVWSAMLSERPDGLLLLGDTIYLDNDQHRDPAALGAELRGLWPAQLAEPHFAVLVSDLRARGAPVLAVYDDHDFIGDKRYGGDFEPALREAARAELQRALAPERAGGGCYTEHPVELAEVILLDVRFHRRAPCGMQWAIRSSRRLSGTRSPSPRARRRWRSCSRRLSRPGPARLFPRDDSPLVDR